MEQQIIELKLTDAIDINVRISCLDILWVGGVLAGSSADPLSAICELKFTLKTSLTTETIDYKTQFNLF